MGNVFFKCFKLQNMLKKQENSLEMNKSLKVTRIAISAGELSGDEHAGELLDS